MLNIIKNLLWVLFLLSIYVLLPFTLPMLS